MALIKVKDVKISIHALREEGDDKRTIGSICKHRFLSTPSARRATACAGDASFGLLFLSTPSARRATGFLLS